MAKLICVYVPRPSAENFKIGIEQGIWGWRSSALDRGDGRGVAASMSAGDFLLLGHRGPNSRVAAGGWDHAVMQRLIVARVTEGLYSAVEPVWPDDVYPERIRLDILDDRENVPGDLLGPSLMEALRLSANRQGAPVRGGISPQLLEFVSNHEAADEEELPDSLPDSGSTDVLTAQLVRREQQKLRKRLFGARQSATCAFCGRVLPTGMLRVAHIKRRAEATHSERHDLANVMSVCVLGCDGLFESGYLYVDSAGAIRMSIKAHHTEDLKIAAASYDGTACGAHTVHSSHYFAHHRKVTGND